MQFRKKLLLLFLFCFFFLFFVFVVVFFFRKSTRSKDTCQFKLSRGGVTPITPGPCKNVSINDKVQGTLVPKMVRITQYQAPKE